MTTKELTTRSECTICGILMRRTWTDDFTDYTWRAVDGTIVGTAEGVPAGAPTNTPELLELLAERGDMHSYSTVLACYQLGHLDLPWEHLHRAVEPASTIDPQDVPECHGWPMRAAPSAWICRVDGTITRRDLAPGSQHHGRDEDRQG
jgi:hypothetical protein